MAKPVTFAFKGMNNVADPASIDALNSQSSQYGQCSRIVNMNCTDLGVTSRDGYVLALAGAAHSGWSDGITAYVVKGGYLCTFNGTTTTNLIAVNPVLPMSYCKVNGLVVATNGQQYIVVENGVASLSNLTPGQYVAFYNGRVYVANGAELIVSDPYNVDSSDIRQMHIPITDDPITGLGAVDNGLYIGTTKETFFIGGGDPFEGGMKLEQVAGYGVVARTMQVAENGQVKLSQLSGKVAVWDSARGFCIGGAGGQFRNISETVAALPIVDVGASFIRETGGEVHFVTVTGGGTAFNYYQTDVTDITEY